MKTAARIRMGILVILSAVFLVTGCYEGAYVAQKVTTSGTVSVRDKDASGKAKSVEIKSGAEPGIIVENSGKGKDLIGMIGKTVEVSGMARGGAAPKQIKVESYKVID